MVSIGFVVGLDQGDARLDPHALFVRWKQHPRIAKVANLGSRQALLVIEPDLDTLQDLGLSLEQVAEAIARNSLEIRSGELKNAAGRLLLRGDGYADGLQQLSSIALHSSAQGTVTLGDGARIGDGRDEIDGRCEA